jgi:hypothetical protein
MAHEQVAERTELDPDVSDADDVSDDDDVSFGKPVAVADRTATAYVAGGTLALQSQARAQTPGVRALEEENAMLRRRLAELEGERRAFESPQLVTDADARRPCAEVAQFAAAVRDHEGVVQVVSWQERERVHIRVLTNDWDLETQRAIIAQETELLDSKAVRHCLEIVPLYGADPSDVLPGQRELVCH